MTLSLGLRKYITLRGGVRPTMLLLQWEALASYQSSMGHGNHYHFRRFLGVSGFCVRLFIGISRSEG